MRYALCALHFEAMAISTIAVLGAGNGGSAAAADLTLRGYETRLFSRSAATLEPIRERGIELVEDGGMRTARPEIVTTGIAEAVAGADLIVVSVPAVAHAYMAQALAPLLTATQIVHLNPGHTGGSLHFANCLREAGCNVPPRCCETVTLTYICRFAGPARVEVYRRTVNLKCAAFPAKIAPVVLPALAEVFPNIVAVENVLETGLSNINAIMHPAGMVGNAGWIERHAGDLLFYREALSPAVARTIEAVDNERLEIVKALELTPHAFIEIFHSAGLTSDAALASDSVYQALQESAPNRTIKAPRTLDHRYMHEDVGYGLVPMAELARLLEIDTPVIDALITLASTMNAADYRREGLTLEKMGLRNATVAELRSTLVEGFQG